MYVSDDELNDWYAERDATREKVFTFAKTYLRWGQVRRIPINLVSELVRCDLCNRPKHRQAMCHGTGCFTVSGTYEPGTASLPRRSGGS